MATLTLKSPEAMQAWGRQIAKVLQGGDVLALIGELGSGKTTLVQGIAAGWGYKRRANSPTFALVNEYKGRRGLLLHMDMYRLSPAELEMFPLEDYLAPNNVCLIEWADRVRPRLPLETLQIEFGPPILNTRRVKITASPGWRKRPLTLPLKKGRTR